MLFNIISMVFVRAAVTQQGVQSCCRRFSDTVCLFEFKPQKILNLFKPHDATYSKPFADERHAFSDLLGANISVALGLRYLRMPPRIPH